LMVRGVGPPPPAAAAAAAALRDPAGSCALQRAWMAAKDAWKADAQHKKRPCVRFEALGVAAISNQQSVSQ